MKILAKTIKGQEFIYSPKTAGRVSERNAQKVCDIVNQFKTLLGCNDNECYHVYDVSEYDNAYWYAQNRRFILHKDGTVSVKNY